MLTLFRHCLYVLPVLVVFLLFGCQQAYYSTMERLGFPKREILVDRVEEARDAQNDAKEQFKTALERFQNVVDFQGGELEEAYDLLDREYEESKAAASEVSVRIERVEDVAEALFEEWESELEEYQDPDLRRSSRQKLSRTRARYQELIKAMRSAESRISPVLETFQDHVLYLKHNLNARAVASLEGELASIRSDVQSLVASMEESIDRANAFIRDMGL